MYWWSYQRASDKLTEDYERRKWKSCHISVFKIRYTVCEDLTVRDKQKQNTYVCFSWQQRMEDQSKRKQEKRKHCDNLEEICLLLILMSTWYLKTTVFTAFGNALCTRAQELSNFRPNSPEYSHQVREACAPFTA